jgi:arginyl-tRNA synthetase
MHVIEGRGNKRPVTETIMHAISTVAPPGAIASVEVRRSPSIVADVAVIMCDSAWYQIKWGLELVETLLNDKRFVSIQHKKQRLTLRLSNNSIFELGSTLETGESGAFDAEDLLAGRKYLVDFCDPNANKALHVGHLRNIALGNALAFLFEAAGATVLRQSVVCDFGLNIAEAIAGYLQFHASSDPMESGLRSDVFVGRCYSDYVHSTNHDLTSFSEDPVRRELVTQRDFSQSILARLMNRDAEVMAVWKLMREWALEGQRGTFERLEVQLDRLVYESEAMNGIDVLVGTGLSMGIFERGEQGAVIYRTGRPEFETLVLLRPDGFPTEHMRALVLWSHMQSSLFDACVHVMGDEWVVSTIEREKILSRLMPIPLFESYILVPYGMVTLGGLKMKSSTDHVMLIEEVLDEAERAFSGPLSKVAARIAVMSYFLNRPMSSSIEFELARVLDGEHNPGMNLALAWLRAKQEFSAGCAPDPENPLYRFAVLQAHNLYRMVRRSLEIVDVSVVLGFLIHLARWYQGEAVLSASAHRVVYYTLQYGLSALGLVRSNQTNNLG